jgi:tetratricopeptide (TPR) repeat protein
MRKSFNVPPWAIRGRSFPWRLQQSLPSGHLHPGVVSSPYLSIRRGYRHTGTGYVHFSLHGPGKIATLISWKEIAAFLGRAERTVKRWESDRGLPVHRVPGGERGGVFAYPEELRAWLLGELGLGAPDSSAAENSKEPSNSAPPERPGPVIQLAPSPVPAAARSSVLPHYVTLSAAAVGVIGFAIGSILVVSHYSLIASALRRTNSAGSNISAHIPKPQAESLYLQGRYQWSLRTADSLGKSVDAYTQAIVLDPQYAQAYAGLAESYELLPEYGHVSQSDSYARASVAASRAIEIDPNLAAGHRAKAFALFWGAWDVPGSDAEFKRALALAPSEPETHHWYATTLLSRQQYAAAIAEADVALRLGPGNAAVAADNAWIHASLPGNRPAAISTLRELARTQSALVKPSRYLARLELEDGNYTGFVADIQNAASISHDPDEMALADAAARGWVHSGKTGLLEGIRSAQKAAFDRGTTSGFALAKTYLLLGKPNDALPYFKAAFDKNDFNLMSLPSCDCISSLKDDPGYTHLLRRIHERMHSPRAALTDLASVSIPQRPPISAVR